jgi:hypothetical protein
MVTAKRLSANTSVSRWTEHTSWRVSLVKKTALLSRGARVV